MNVSPCRSSNLTQAAAPRPKGPILAQAAKAMAGEHQISVRTAYRHLARGTTPAGDRRIGRDGKTYPACTRRLLPRRTPVERELALSWQALNRADQRACQQGLAGTNVELLRGIASTAREMLSRWTSQCPDTL